MGKENLSPPNDIMDVTPPAIDWLNVGLYALLATLALWLVWRFLRKYLAARQARPVRIEEPKVSPWDELHQQIKTLKVLPLSTSKDMKDYFFSFSMLTRRLLELKTGVTYTDMTLQELEQPLRRRPVLSRSDTDHMLDALKDADAVKFADREGSAELAREYAEALEKWFQKLQGPRQE
jgi:hypothetical protein